MIRAAAVDLMSKIQGVWPERWPNARVEQWLDALESCEETPALSTFLSLRSSAEKCPSIAEFLASARPASRLQRGAHSFHCMCSGVGWLEVEQHDELGVWWAWVRCSSGPPTGFAPDGPDLYDPVAGEAAYATHAALIATAETRSDHAEACFAAAAAYQNAERKTLL